jgi:hypothetical protein
MKKLNCKRHDLLRIQNIVTETYSVSKGAACFNRASVCAFNAETTSGPPKTLKYCRICCFKYTIKWYWFGLVSGSEIKNERSGVLPGGMRNSTSAGDNFKAALRAKNVEIKLSVKLLNFATKLLAHMSFQSYLRSTP